MKMYKVFRLDAGKRKKLLLLRDNLESVEESGSFQVGVTLPNPVVVCAAVHIFGVLDHLDSVRAQCNGMRYCQWPDLCASLLSYCS